MTPATTATLPTRRQPRLFSVDEYEAMGAAGILRADDRVELIRGVIVEMPPIGGPHGWTVTRAHNLLTSELAGRAVVLSQMSLRLAESEPEPDVLVLSPATPPDTVPTAEHVLLVIEVAETSLHDDLTEKVPLYAENGIPETWVLDVAGRRIHVFRDLREGVYATSLVVGGDEAISPEAFAGVEIRPADVFGN